MTTKRNSWGGPRPNSGAKPLYDAPMANMVIRVPDRLNEWLAKVSAEYHVPVSTLVRQILLDWRAISGERLAILFPPED